MSYVKTVWKDRVVEKPRTFTITNNGDGTSTLTPAPGAITEAGTPVVAAELNRIENGVESLDNKQIQISASDPSIVVAGQIFYRKI